LNVKEKIVIHFPASLVEQPYIYWLVKEYDLVINILKANINPRKEGRLVLELSGEEDRFREGIDFLRSRGLEVMSLKQEIIWNEERCTHCGVCTGICPTGALHMQRPQMLVRFDEEKCIVCEHCLRACPVRAIEAYY